MLFIVMCDVLIQMCVLTLLSDLPQHTLILDVKTQKNSLYLMIERFFEQFSAIQAAVMDPRLRKLTEKNK